MLYSLTIEIFEATTEMVVNHPTKHKAWNDVPSQLIAKNKSPKQQRSSSSFYKRTLTTDSRLLQSSVEFLTAASLPMQVDTTHIHLTSQLLTSARGHLQRFAGSWQRQTRQWLPGHGNIPACWDMNPRGCCLKCSGSPCLGEESALTAVLPF